MIVLLLLLISRLINRSGLSNPIQKFSALTILKVNILNVFMVMTNKL